MPTILTSGPYRFFFFSNEGNEPIHVHVESSDNYAKYWIDPVRLERSIGFNSKELGEIRDLIMKNLDIIRGKWYEHFKH